MFVLVIICSALGSFLAGILACVPGLHVYNVMAVFTVVLHLLEKRGIFPPGEVLVAWSAGMTVGYSLISTVSSVLVSAPDESSIFTVQPGQKLLMKGRGYEAVVITSAGGIMGLFALLLSVPLIAGRLPAVYTVLRPHSHWILWCVICFMLMSEWPKGPALGQGGWTRFRASWRSTGMGLVTFLLSGLMGFILMYKSPISSGSAFQNLMPAFVGLFTLPWLVLNIVGSAKLPSQGMECDLSADELAQGGLAGIMGGSFAAFFPVVTGGVGGMLAGHAVALRNDRAFLASQGASKITYYAGGLLLFFVPFLNLTRGGGAWTLSGFYRPEGYGDCYLALSSLAIGGAVAVAMIFPLTRSVLILLKKHGQRRVSAVSFAIALTLVALITGWRGLTVSAVALGIGLLPVVFGSRRMNCLGVILLPMACSMSGAGDNVAGLLGLL